MRRIKIKSTENREQSTTAVRLVLPNFLHFCFYTVFFHAEYAEIAETMRNKNALIREEYAEAHATLRHRSDGKHKQRVCASANSAYSA